ncbi:GntR family transcriptional regulator [Microbacterium faecale]|uniref:GntR family transcriptional regulator n=1 Tax=Microbacterium faecale TaxID=1804630 RepID=A0A916Y494_9MICO|nr:GntR family transcriptional regulator [Microbacterium faecale]GGD30636.1 GntR family transcriptional regulator [Microbacterium faecale]
MMRLLTGDGPIYQQLADRVAEDILAGTFSAGSHVPSTNEYAAFYEISPITASKGLNLLVEQGVLHMKRGVGMFVTDDALTVLQARRRTEFREKHVLPLIREARLLHIAKDEIAEMIDQEDDR